MFHKFLRFTVILAMLIGSVSAQQVKSRLEIKDGWYYIDDQKVFVNALGYEIGARPGQHPYSFRKPEPVRMKQDLEVIKQAGFNAIRTWSELYEDELKVVQKSGLKIIFGLWVEPNFDFSDLEVMAEEIEDVKKVLAYSKNYDCIITYLVMNEPMPQHIQKIGAQATVDLWTKLRDLIHKEHPGIPVTITGNSAITEFVNMNIFDVYAYNAYDYDGFNYTLGYANAARILAEMNAQGKPLVMTEFGMSVSREGGGRYGGNTMAQQMEILPKYYRNLLDAGAVGACPFYFADGWWKGGEPAIHNDTPEEWFGYWGYSDINDTVGYPRPVWHAVKQYNMALVTSPKNQMFYRNEIPLEMFLQDNVASIRILYHDRIVYSKKEFTSNHLLDNLSFTDKELTDRELIFEFYDQKGTLLKLESIIVLTGEKEVEWPTISLSTDMKDLNENKEIKIKLNLKNGDVFTLGNEVRYLYSHHIGWTHGELRHWAIDPAEKEQTFRDSYSIPDESPLLGLYAGVDIRYGKFIKTIYDHQFVYRGDWADPIRLK